MITPALEISLVRIVLFLLFMLPILLCTIIAGIE